MVLESYFDGSNHADLSQFDRVMLAAVSDNCQQWDGFSVDWNEVLARHNVPYLHVTEAVTLNGPFSVSMGTCRDTMNTGHRGSLATIHASSAEEAIHRLATLVMRGSIGLSLDAIKEDVRRGIDLIVYIQREHGRRRIHQVLDMRA